MNIERFSAELLKALAHPARLGILNVLRADGECCVCHLEARLGLRQAYLSQQLARLREAGLVNDRREGLNVFYAVAHPELEPLLSETRKCASVLAARANVALRPGRSTMESHEPCPCPNCEKERTPQPAAAAGAE
ncbi:MAG: metalloregulator ArsR/SmtB family transcription factor [Anaerolineales bacterium]|jgi:DNA-binding transcriptional ArsR family regulator